LCNVIVPLLLFFLVVISLRTHDATLRQDTQEMLQRALDVRGIFRLERDLHHVVGMVELRIRPEHQIRELAQRIVEELGDRPSPTPVYTTLRQ